MRWIGIVWLSLVVTMAGCGDGDANNDELDSPPPPIQVRACDGEPAADAPAADLELEVHRDSLSGLARGEEVEWVLVLTNAGDAPVELVFFSGQLGDVTLSDEGGEVYRWSAARMFSQSIQCATVGPGNAGSIILGDDILEINPGEYRLEATVTSRPAPPPFRQDVTVGS